MLVVIILTLCVGWSLASIAAAFVLGAAIERRDAYAVGVGAPASLSTLHVRAPRPAGPLSLAQV